MYTAGCLGIDQAKAAAVLLWALCEPDYTANGETPSITCTNIDAYVCCAGRLGINQAKAAAARRERKIWAGAADGHDESDAFGVDESNMACIDGLSLFDDAIFFTEVSKTLASSCWSEMLLGQAVVVA